MKTTTELVFKRKADKSGQTERLGVASLVQSDMKQREESHREQRIDGFKMQRAIKRQRFIKVQSGDGRGRSGDLD